VPFLSLQLGFLRLGYSVDVSVTHTSHSDEIAVQHPNAPTRDRADGEFRLPRQAQLAHDEHVERYVERRRHLEPDGDSASRKGKDEYVGPVRIDAKFGGEPPTSIVAVTKSRTHTLAPCAQGMCLRPSEWIDDGRVSLSAIQVAIDGTASVEGVLYHGRLAGAMFARLEWDP